MQMVTTRGVDRLLSPREVTKLLGISPSTLARIKDELPPAFRSRSGVMVGPSPPLLGSLLGVPHDGKCRGGEYDERRDHARDDQSGSGRALRLRFRV
jgi:hypothetical protein